MGGFFGVVSRTKCINDLFYGTDYNSHLGTKRAGMATYSKEQGFVRAIHNIESSYFRNKFDGELNEFEGTSGIGVISDNDSQPIIVRSHLGRFALVTVAKIANLDELEHKLLDEGEHFSEQGTAGINPTEVVALLISLTIYAVNAFRQTVERGFNLALQAKASAVRQSDPICLADRVMERYRNLTPEQKAGTGSPEYRALFAAEEASEEYQALLPILYNCLETANVFDVYLAMYDEESCAMVYLVDPETEDRLFPGQWESVSEKGMRKFLNDI